MVRNPMPTTSDSNDGSAPTLNVGITGHRSIATEPIVASAVKAAIARVLRALSSEGRPSGTDKHSATLKRFRLNVISMLAEGADLLGMQAGLDCGAELVGVLPFDQQSYRGAFASVPDRDLFDSLWNRLSSIVVLSGSVGDDAAYEHANREILDRSDVLIAVWDGDPARGRGGTGDVVHEALERGLPIIVIRPDVDATPKLLGANGETSFCADLLDVMHLGGARAVARRYRQVPARSDSRE